MIPLSYDDLPPGSDIRRERDAEGVVRINVPAGEPTREVRRRVFNDALARGTLESIPLLLLAVVVFCIAVRVQRVYGGLLWAAWAFFALFGLALCALVVWLRYGTMLDAACAGRRQATVIAVTPARLLVETTGPFATASYHFSPEQVRAIHVARGGLLDELGMRRRVDHLLLERPDGRSVALLPGRDRAELAAVRQILQATLRTAQVRTE